MPDRNRGAGMHIHNGETAVQHLSATIQNLYWCWRPFIPEIFRQIDLPLWRQVRHNPQAFLLEMPAAELMHRLENLNLESTVNYARHRLQEYLHDPGPAAHEVSTLKASPVAYFSAEFGIHESLPIYAGGLGILAGDHLKAASDMGIPLVGVGLLYDSGYFIQHLDKTGWQQEEYLPHDPLRLPVSPAIGRNGRPVQVTCELRDRRIRISVFQVHVGRCALYLLDSDVPDNCAEDRKLTSRLYGGDVRVRIGQELILGVGGLRALKAMGINPGVLHLNEGHSAFALLEAARQCVEDDGCTFAQACRLVAAKAVFTTHTPVEAGHDRFSAELIDEYLGNLRERLKIDAGTLLGLGRVNPDNRGEAFCMTVLALKLSDRANGVAALHGRVSRQMWHDLWPARPEREVPLGHITNGIHVTSWIAPSMYRLLEKTLGKDFHLQAFSPETITRIQQIDEAELWEERNILKKNLITYVQQRITGMANPADPGAAARARATAGVLQPHALTIGFARRFATYKRATLLLADPDRLANILNNPERPVQFIFAGKSHPHDDGGKRFIQEIVQLQDDPRFRGRIVFVENYDIAVARRLVYAVDVWLNNPLRPHEACGTSGMKVVLNGGLHLSTLDGWWAEAYDGENGFAIGSPNIHVNHDVQWQRDADALYAVLENEVVPMYYERSKTLGLPRRWLQRIKHSMITLGWRFNANRMVLDYLRNMYLPAADANSCGMS